MKYTVQQVEDVMNYMKVHLNATEIFMLYLDNDRIGYFDTKGVGHVRDFSRIYQEMLDKFSGYDIMD